MVPLRDPYIVYAEDDADDREFFVEVIRQMPQKLFPVVYENGLPVIQHLEALQAADPLPRCVVLDMNMPVWDGIKTLQTIRSSGRYGHLPVVIFTTSSAERDRRRCLELGANGFLTKPSSRAEAVTAAIELLQYIS